MAAQLHLALNHLPVVTLLLSIVVWSWGLVLGKAHIRHVAMGLLLLGGILSGPAFLSGEQAEEELEEVIAAEEPFIEEHEDAAKVALALGLAVAAMSAGFFALRVSKKESAASTLEYLSIGVGLIAFLLMARAAHFGGMIRHPEVRGTQVTEIPSSSSPEQAETD